MNRPEDMPLGLGAEKANYEGGEQVESIADRLGISIGLLQWWARGQRWSRAGEVTSWGSARLKEMRDRIKSLHAREDRTTAQIIADARARARAQDNSTE